MAQISSKPNSFDEFLTLAGVPRNTQSEQLGSIRLPSAPLTFSDLKNPYGELSLLVASNLALLGYTHQNTFVPRVETSRAGINGLDLVAPAHLKQIGAGSEHNVFINLDSQQVEKYPSRTRISTFSHGSFDCKRTDFDLLVCAITKAVETRAAAAMLGIEHLDPWVDATGVYHERALPAEARPVNINQFFAARNSDKHKFDLRFFQIDTFRPVGNLFLVADASGQAKHFLVDGLSPYAPNLTKAKSEAQRHFMARASNDMLQLTAAAFAEVLGRIDGKIP